MSSAIQEFSKVFIATQQGKVGGKEHPGSDYEQAIIDMIRGWARYADAHRERYGSPLAGDFYCGPPWIDTASNIVTMLGGERGRIDAGPLDGFIRRTAVAHGFSQDLSGAPTDD